MAVEMLSRGVWGVLATPFNGSTLDLDEGSLDRLVRYYDSIGVVGLTALGVFGEAAALDSEEREAVLEILLEASELPIVVGATTLATAPVIDEIRLANEILGDRLVGAMVQVNSTDPDVLAKHFRAIYDATGVGIVAQDYPAASGVRIAPERLAAALTRLDCVVAVKAEAPPTSVSVAKLVQVLPGLPIFGGLGGIGLIDELCLGAAGAMTGFSFPEALIATVQAHTDGGYDAARAALIPYLPLINLEQQAGIALPIRKECLRRRGLILENLVRPPANSLPEVLVEQVNRQVSAATTLLAQSPRRTETVSPSVAALAVATSAVGS